MADDVRGQHGGMLTGKKPNHKIGLHRITWMLTVTCKLFLKQDIASIYCCCNVNIMGMTLYTAMTICCDDLYI